MDLILTVLLPFPLGCFLASRTAAAIAYSAAFSFVFTFQTLSLVVDWAEGNESAFGGPFPASDYGQVLSYGVVNLVIYAVGWGLLFGAHRLRTRRRTRAATGTRAVSLDPVG